MKTIKLIILSFLISVSGFSQKAELLVTFDKANKLYVQGQFENAILLYDSVINSGFESAELYYNAGNACYRTNKYTDAIYYYEKAKLINPSDEALQHNLELANLQIYDKIEPMPEFAFKGYYRAILKSQSADFWAYTSVFFFVIVLGLIYLYLVSGNRKTRLFSFVGGIILLVFSTSSFVFSGERQEEQVSPQSAIIYAPAVSVKSEPNESSAELFMIHEGLKVEITDYSELWFEVKLASGLTGWVKKSDLKTL